MKKISPKEYKRRAEIAFAACRSIQFAVKDAERNGDTYNLTAIKSAERLAIMARSRYCATWNIKPQDQEKFDCTDVLP